MRIEEAYRVLEIPPTASEAEVRAAHRDLTKVWHPDRFAHDPAMQRKAEERLKQINEALDTIVAGGSRYDVPAAVRPGMPLLWIFTSVFLALFILVRRPTFGGLLFALALIVLAFVLTLRKR